MRLGAAFLLAALAVATAPPAWAQQICKTGFGTCRIGGSGGTPGGACTCLLSNGPVQGVIEGGASFAPAAERLPQYCCTPAGRFPSASARSASGQGCQARLPNGSVAAGQSCF